MERTSNRSKSCYISKKSFVPVLHPVEAEGFPSPLALRLAGNVDDTEASESDIEENERRITKRKTEKVKKSRSILNALIKKRNVFCMSCINI